MCIITATKPKLQVAEDDIKAYKYVHLAKIVRYGFLGLKKKFFFKSFHTGFIYRHDKVYRTKLDEFRSIWPNVLSSLGQSNYRSGEGFYSWLSPKHANAACIIPKGAKYYCVFDDSGRIVYISDQIKITEIWKEML